MIFKISLSAIILGLEANEKKKRMEVEEQKGRETQVGRSKC